MAAYEGKITVDPNGHTATVAVTTPSGGNATLYTSSALSRGPLVSPNGTVYYVTVNNSGALVVNTA